MSTTSSSSSSSSQLLFASFNQDGSCFAIGTSKGYKIFNCRSGRLRYERDYGAVSIVEMYNSTSLIAIVGAGEQPSLSPRRLCLYDTIKESAQRELNFLTSILAIRLSKKRLVVVLRDKTYIYDSDSLAILDTINTVPNTKGLCAFAPGSDGCYLALPASTTNGSVLVYNTMELHSHCQIDAHTSPLAALALSIDGVYMATASEQGTLVRVHVLMQPAKQSYTFRRGSYPSNICSLSFVQGKQAPDLLVSVTSAGSVHVFSITRVIDRSMRRSASLLASMIPNRITDVLDSSHHYVLQNAVPSGVKSVAVIHNIDDSGAYAMQATAASPRAHIYMISYNGYFQEYSLRIDVAGASSWKLERELNLLECSSIQ